MTRFINDITQFGARGGIVGWDTALCAGKSRVRFPIVSLTQPFRQRYETGVVSASNRNDYQKYFRE